ncbi:MAG TPA: hypoxanthine phosphoribosyltransferase [Stellaceae bacterium]|jgi:hypoxanthine phosphoribosyltransferase|nr:hypoxanthine phosphoribosyltransferase [Stellaceae bacterium]
MIPDGAEARQGEQPGDRLEPLLSEAQLQARIGELARQIDADYRNATREHPLCLIAVLKGACIFAADLMRHLTVPVTLEFIAASSYGKGTRSSGAVALDGVARLDIAARPVLVLDDILDTGLTIAVILDRLRALGPASLELCMLLRKPADGRPDLPVRYVGFDIPAEFVVGYGMDHAERHRNLRGIYKLILSGTASDRIRL